METPGECTFEFLPWPFSDSIVSVKNAESTPTLAPLLLVGLYQERRLPPQTCTKIHPLQYLASPPVLNQVPIPTILYFGFCVSTSGGTAGIGVSGRENQPWVFFS